MRRLDQLTSDEACYEPVALSIWCVVVHKNVIGVFSSLREALRCLLVRLWDGA